METDYNTEELITRAVELLEEDYDPENDAFFVVVTHGGKDDNVFSGSQAIIGEINLKTIIAFTTQMVSQLSEAIGVHPFTFITRHIVAHFVDMERAHLNAASIATGIVVPEEPPDESLDLPDGESDPGFFVKNPALDDIEN